jgi:CMP/dCMP kinase
MRWRRAPSRTACSTIRCCAMKKSAASSVHPEVRAALKQRQLDFANQPGGAVLDGRDIGTVIAPHADAKLFVTASAEVRARRRYEEMLLRGLDVDFENILTDIRLRDERDANRATAPLKPADDAILFDNGDLTVDEAILAAIAAVDGMLQRG